MFHLFWAFWHVTGTDAQLNGVNPAISRFNLRSLPEEFGSLIDRLDPTNFLLSPEAACLQDNDDVTPVLKHEMWNQYLDSYLDHEGTGGAYFQIV